jgi:hypothetical protein
METANKSARAFPAAKRHEAGKSASLKGRLSSLPKSRRALLTPGYMPPVEVLPDSNFKNRHIADTQVEVGDVVNVFPALNALQTDHPNGREIQRLARTTVLLFQRF